MNSKTKKITTIAMLASLSYIAVAFGRIPLVLFLKYDPKDIVITLGGLIWGPFTAFIVSVIVSFVEMFTLSDTGIFGFIMNIISTCSFACTSAYIYKRYFKKSPLIGLFAGYISMVLVMILWNYLISPIYMGYTREAVAKLILPAFLPFNLIKGGLNTVIVILIYKPILNSLEKNHLVPIKNENAF
jgi:riboflavin transporter FmnP